VTFQEEMAQSVKDLRDNQIVQGQILNRVELNLELVTERLGRLDGIVEQNSLAIGRLADGMLQLQSATKGTLKTVEGLATTVGGLSETMGKLTENVGGLSVIVQGLSETVDRFIRGMEGNGNHR
jgi:methyl-accepting chemotaxis protein